MLRILLIFTFLVSCSKLNDKSSSEPPIFKNKKTKINKTTNQPSDIINDILLPTAEAAHSIPMAEGCQAGWTKIRGGGPTAYYFCILPEAKTERYSEYLDIPHQEIKGHNVDKIYDYASVCAEQGADWCTVQELMAASKQGVIELSAQSKTYAYNESCTSLTNFSGTTTFAKYPSRFCMEKEAAGGEACSGKYFFTKYTDDYFDGCEDAHENRAYYGWDDSSYSWVNVNIFCCYR